MNDNVAPAFYYAAVFRNGRAGRLRPDKSARGAEQRLTPGAGLIVVLLLSLGLWGAIGLVVTSLTAGWPW